MLRDQVLGGDLELQLNGSLSKFHDTEFEVQVDKTEFMERYERRAWGANLCLKQVGHNTVS